MASGVRDGLSRTGRASGPAVTRGDELAVGGTRGLEVFVSFGEFDSQIGYVLFEFVDPSEEC